MRLFERALMYWGLVFGAGFFLGTIRMLWVAPWVGERTAQLIEIPVMLVAIVLAADWTNRHLVDRNSARSRVMVGFMALGLMLAAEIGVGMSIRGQSAFEAIVSRDPVTGTAYYLALGAFALMPWMLGRST